MVDSQLHSTASNQSIALIANLAKNNLVAENSNQAGDKQAAR